MAVADGNEGSLGRPDGSVLIEFAFSFPMLLLTFMFTYQILQVYNYDVLGAYAAYAAARSYSVFRNHQGWLAEEQRTGPYSERVKAARAKAAVMARDVAASIMAPYTVSYGAFDTDWAGESMSGDSEVVEERTGVARYWDLMTLAGSHGSRLAYRAALARMTRSDSSSDEREPFLITEYGPDGKTSIAVGRRYGESDVAGVLPITSDGGFDLRFRPGYYYLDNMKQGPEETASDKPWWQQWWDDLCNVTSNFWDSLFGSEDSDATAMRVARVSFTYRYPLFISFMRHGYLRRDPNVDTSPISIPIYQACAMPIEPFIPQPEDPRDDTYEPLDTSNDEEQQRLRAQNRAVMDALEALQRFIMAEASACGDDAPPEGAVAILKARADRHRSAVDWGDGKAPSAWLAAQHLATAHVWPDAPSFEGYYLWNPQPGTFEEFRRANSVPCNQEVGDWWSPPKELHDVRRMLEDEVAYRTKVIEKWIAEEIRVIKADQTTLAAINREYSNPTGRRICSPRQRRDSWQDEDGDVHYGEWEDAGNYECRTDLNTGRLAALRGQLSSYYGDAFKASFVPQRRYRDSFGGWRYGGRKERYKKVRKTGNNEYASDRSNLRVHLREKLGVWQARKATEEGIKTRDNCLLKTFERHISTIGEALEHYYALQAELRQKKKSKITASREALEKI